MENQVIWITGASSGIGEAMAKEAARKGAKVILSARRREELERVKAACGGECYVVPLDLTDKDSVAAAVADVRARLGRVDILVNNGGVSQRSLAAETSEEVDRRMMEVNYFGTISLTKAVLPLMIAQQSGHIAVVTSLSGLFGWYQRSAYCAAKHALHGFFEALALEEAKYGLTVTLACPGPVATNIDLNALDEAGKPMGKRDAFNRDGMTAEACAARILRAIARKEKRVVVARKEKIVALLHRYCPPLFWMIAKGQDPRK